MNQGIIIICILLGYIGLNSPDILTKAEIIAKFYSDIYNCIYLPFFIAIFSRVTEDVSNQSKLFPFYSVRT